MTLAMKKVCKQEAQKAMRENGIKVFQKDMVLLEAGSHSEDVFGIKVVVVDYVMFEDKATGKQYQCYYGSQYYNPETDSLWAVEEYSC